MAARHARRSTQLLHAYLHDKTAFITMDSANVLSAIVVNNAGVTQAQKELFDHLWSAL